jgi:hypothetical protein
MKTANRIALIYGVSLLGAGAVSFARGRRGQELLLDTALHGGAAGTVLNLVGYVMTSQGAVPVFAMTNTSEDMGKTPDKAVELLDQLDTDSLYATLKENGVTIDAIPSNPSVVVQE